MGSLGPGWDRLLKVRAGFRVEVGPSLPRVPELNALVSEGFHEFQAAELRTSKRPVLDLARLVFVFAIPSVLIKTQQPKVVA